MPHVLIAADDRKTLHGLAELVAREGFTTTTAATPAELQMRIAERRPDLILLDSSLPDDSERDLIGSARRDSGCEIILVADHTSVETSIQALRLGASDCLIKPVRTQQLRRILSRAARPDQLRFETGNRSELRRLGRFGRLLGISPSMQRVYDQIERVAPTSATVLVTGESGTGKEMVAQTLHELSARSRQVFLPLNCGAISPQLIESELFGHEKGSFTGALREHRGYFERANGGTLFLDEITEMPIELQVKLLRVLETRMFSRVGSDHEIETDVRIIAATNRSPEEAVAEGRLRADLLYRLQVFPIQLPPLCERGDDVELLANHFLNELNRSEHATKVLSEGALAALKRYHWPGNVRELNNVIHRAFIMANRVIDESCLPAELSHSRRPSGPCFTVRVGSSVAEVERSLILATLEQCHGTKEKAAEMLGISLKTLYNRLKEYAAQPQPRDMPAPERGVQTAAQGNWMQGNWM